MKINAINSNYSLNQSAKNKNPNFGIVLKQSPDLYNFVKKDTSNLAVKLGANVAETAADNVQRFKEYFTNIAQKVAKLEPKELVIETKLSTDGAEYVNNPCLDGKLFHEITDKKPFFIGFKDPTSKDGTLIATPSDLPTQPDYFIRVILAIRDCYLGMKK